MSFSIDSCKCGETTLLSSMMMVDIPCSHRYSKGAAFPSRPIGLRLNLKNSTTVLNTDVTIVELDQDNEQKDYDTYINSLAAKTVRKFTKFKKTPQIAKQIPTISIEKETSFANGKPMGFFSAVSEGIHKFSDYKKGTNETSASSDASSEDILH